MAEEIIFKTSVDTGTTAKDLQAIDKELGNIDKTTKSASNDLNKTFDDLNARVESGTMSMRESAKAIKDYQTIALQAGRESPIGKEALQRAGDLKDKLGDLKTEINNLGADGQNMKAALQLGSTITAGYGALTGAQALLGTESENLTKTLVKLQAVQAILAAIEEVRASLEKESILMQKAKVIQTNILSAATAAYTVVVGTSTGAIKLLRIAMLAIPIVALVAGVAALATGLISLGNSAQDAYERTKRLREEQERLAKSLAEVSRQNLGNQFGNLNDKIAQNIELRRAQGATEKEIFQLQKDAIEQQIRQLEVQNASGTRLNAQQTKQYKQLKSDLLVLEAEYNTSLSEAAEQRNQDAKRKSEERLEQQANENFEAYKRRLENERSLQLAEDEWKLEQETLANEAQALKEQAEQAREQELSAFRIGLWENELAAEKRIEEEKIRAHQETNDAKVKIAEMGTKSLNDLAGAVFAVSNAYGKQDEKSKEDRAKKQFKVMKALSLATAVVDGIQTTMAAFRNGMQNPIPLLGPATAAVYAGAAAITSAANIAKISATKYEGGGGGSVPSVPPPTTVPNTPNPQLANADTTLTSGLSGNANNQGGGKVFVVDSEITAKQNQSAQTLSIATVG